MSVRDADVISVNGESSDKSWPQSGKLTSDMKIVRNGFKSLFVPGWEHFIRRRLLNAYRDQKSM